MQVLYSKSEIQALQYCNILQIEQNRILQTVFRVLETLYKVVIKNGVHCNCLGKCDSTRLLATAQPQHEEAEHIFSWKNEARQN